MIIDFERKTTCERVVRYNEDKVKGGSAERILNQTFGENFREICESLNDVASLNERVYRNKFVHGYMSLAPGENIGDEKFGEIYKDWAKIMGYENCPSVLYRHFDGNNEHIHFITTSIDYQGKKVPEWNDIERNIEACRHLEKVHNLEIVTARDSSIKISLSEINAKRYAFLEGLMKCNRSEILQEGVIELVGKKNLDAIKSGRMSNEHIQSLLGQQKFQEVKAFLNERGLFWSCYKDDFVKKLEGIYRDSKSIDEFLLGTKKEEFYVRKLFDVKGKPFLQYGFPIGDRYQYLNEDRMPDVFRYSNLKNLEPGIDLLVLVKLTEEDQKKSLKSIINNTLKSASNLHEFENTLIGKQVYLKKHSNSGGIYGVSFGLLDHKEFKGSDISPSFSWSKISAKLERNEIRSIPEELFDQKPDRGKSIGTYEPGLQNEGPDTESLFKKKKKKNKGDDDLQR